MTPTDYQRFTAELLRRLEAEPEVVGLVALGSMSGEPPLADAFSDHDFFVVTRAGAQERFRAGRWWLPAPERIAFSFRETAHGLKVLWDDGHLAEYAVFDCEELRLARVNRLSVLLDRGGVAERMAEVRASTAGSVAASSADDDWHLGQLLAALLVGAGRFRRGERLAARRSILGAVEHLAVLMARHLLPRPDARLDELDPLRRMEVAYPAAARVLSNALALEPPDAALALLDLARRELAGRLQAWPEPAATAIARTLREKPGRET